MAEKKPTCSVALVNYKTLQLTSISLNLLQDALAGTDTQVWVVDNDSADESTAHLRSLDWIHLIERKPVAGEPGFMAHGRALDMVLERITTDYLFLLHTDTFIHDPAIFDIMLQKCLEKANVVSVGCVEQVYRGTTRIVWRLVTRFLKHYYRRLKIGLGLKSKAPKPYREVYLKSFCALWNVKIVKEHGMSFSMADRIPGYEMQDRLTALGYKIAYIPARKMFGYLDHVEAGTVAAIGGYDKDHRRSKKYNAILERLNRLA